MWSYPAVLWQVRKDWFRGNQSISLSQDSHHHLTAGNLRQAQFSGANRLFLCHAPAQLNLLHVQAVSCGTAAQLREHALYQNVTLSVHVSERGRNKHTYTSPPGNKGGGWKGERQAGKLYRNNLSRRFFTSTVALLGFVRLYWRSLRPWLLLLGRCCTACPYAPHAQAAWMTLVPPQTWWHKYSVLINVRFSKYCKVHISCFYINNALKMYFTWGFGHWSLSIAHSSCHRCTLN